MNFREMVHERKNAPAVEQRRSTTERLQQKVAASKKKDFNKRDDTVEKVRAKVAFQCCEAAGSLTAGEFKGCCGPCPVGPSCFCRQSYFYIRKLQQVVKRGRV